MYTVTKLSKIFLILLLAFTFSNTQAKESKRKAFDIKEHKFSISIFKKEVPAKLFFPDIADEAVIQILLNDVKDEKAFYERQAFIFQHFLKNYKIGKTNGKKNLIFWIADDKYMSAFSISLNNLRLLNNRDFDTADGDKIIKGSLVYPIKTVIRKGKFKSSPDALTISTKKINQNFQKYLNDYSFGLYETVFETEYLEKKKKK